MDIDFLILKTRAKFDLPHEFAKTIVKSLYIQNRLEDYEKQIDNIQDFNELEKYFNYGGKK